MIDVDGSQVATTGECKQGMDINYQGIWGYAPLIISLAHTKEALYVVNRPGNATSSWEAAPWIDRAIDTVAGVFEKVWLRGDTDFSLTEHLDKWDPPVSFERPLALVALAATFMQPVRAFVVGKINQNHLSAPAILHTRSEPDTPSIRIKRISDRFSEYLLRSREILANFAAMNGSAG